MTRRTPDRNYEEIKEGYFTIVDIQDGKLWFDEMMGVGTKIGPVIVTKQISELCHKYWDVSLALGKHQSKWYILEVGNVYPTG